MDYVDGQTGISVSGTGRVAVPPEIATLTVGVSIEERSLVAAQDAVAVKTMAARNHLVTSGLAESDIQTTRLNVHNSHDRQLRRQTFHVSTSLTAIIRDLSKAESVVNGLFSAVGEGLDMQGLTFGVEDPSRGQQEARALAFADAAGKARHLAGLAGASLGSVLAMSETDSRRHEPMLRGRAAMAMSAEAADIPVEAGELDVVATVNVRWALES